MQDESPQKGARPPQPKRGPDGRQLPPQHGWAPGLAGGPQAPHVSTPGLPPTPGLGEQQGYASQPGLLPSSHTPPALPFGGAYADEGARSSSQPGLMPERDYGRPEWPPAQPPAAEATAWREDQTPPGGWSEPLPAITGGDVADWGTRALATIVDAVIWLAVYVVVALFLGLVFGIGALASGDQSALGAGGIVIGVAGLVVYAAYTGHFMTRPGPRNGQTLGKRLAGIRVVRTDGRPVGPATVALRHWLMKFIVFGVLAAATLYIATLVNYLLPLRDPEGRALHDRVAGTRVVRA